LVARFLVVLSAGVLSFAAGKPVDFDREVRPILSDRCFACHGPDEKRRMANLRLDTEDGLFAHRSGYDIVAPSDPARSRLVARISGAGFPRMPPPQAAPALTEAQIAVIRQWIEEGAKWERHWAFVPPERPALPAVRDEKWPRNPIDYFVLARLEREGLKPAPEADRATLLRRLSFDLTGLPPTTAEIDAFLADKSRDAYEKQVDRLLALPEYGERMASEWLDLARYADTHGYHIDSARDMWKWRDWVIDAFNRNMPYNQFGIEQLAGDLLPNATMQQRLATAFNRNHMINYEAGAIPEEYQVEYVADRVDTTATVFMGLTLGCARCHDHKYDPISQKDYYRFYAFFNTIAEQGLDGKTGNAAPILEMPTAEQASEVAWLEQAIDDHKNALPKEETKPLRVAWEKTALSTLPEAPRDGLVAAYDFGGNVTDSSGNGRDARVTRGNATFASDGPVASAGFDGQTEVEFPTLQSQQFAVAFWMRSEAMPEMAVMAGGPGLRIGVEASHPQPGLQRGSALYIEYHGRRWHSRALVFGEQWQHVAVNFWGAQPELFLQGQPAALEAAGAGGPRPAGPVTIGNPQAGQAFKGGLGGLRFYRRALTPADVEILAEDEPARFILGIQKGDRNKEQRRRLKRHFFTCEAPPELRRIYGELKSLQARRAKVQSQVATVQVMAEMAKPRDTFVLARGDYRNPGEKVTPGVPALLPPLPKDAPANRLSLAEWLFSPQHPLTARVAVNRYWQLFFGIGLVKTAEDFGSQGDAPVERDLLDWLATEFQKNWDVKAIERLIVTSATYRQSSEGSAELRERDPENRLLARGPRFRLPAEMVRDNALAVSRLLHKSIGGPSVFPYQPPGLWEELSRGFIYTAQEYHQSQGADLYRRSLYTFWKRTVPPPELSAFDAPDREKCTARRIPTNTPLQALVLLNDPTYVEAARVLAERGFGEGPAETRARIGWIFREATSRRPSPEETRVLVELLERRLEHYRQKPAEAAQLIAIGASQPAKVDPSELAAWTTVASTILNLDETITKE
jgi:hypothetical protein